MSRSKGQNKAQSQRLELIHTIQFNLKLTPERLGLVKLRITQAITRDESLRMLLEPAAQEIDRVLGWNKESVQALNEIKGN